MQGRKNILGRKNHRGMSKQVLPLLEWPVSMEFLRKLSGTKFQVDGGWELDSEKPYMSF